MRINSFCNSLLVGHDNDPAENFGKLCNGFFCAGKKLKFLRTFHIIAGKTHIDDAIPVEEKRPPFINLPIRKVHLENNYSLCRLLFVVGKTDDVSSSAEAAQINLFAVHS